MWRLLIAAVVALPAAAQRPEVGDEAPQDIEGEGGVASSEAKFWRVGLDSQFRMLAVSDEAPENGMALVFETRISAEVFENATGYLRAGLLQSYAPPEPDESSWYIQDVRPGFAYKTPVQLTDDRKLGITHDLAVFLPTSRASQNQDLYAAPMYTLKLSHEVLKGFHVVAIPHFRYRFHQYAERVGPGAPMNTQLDTGIHGALEYGFGVGFGEMSLGGSVGSIWLRRYPSRDDYESEASDQAPWFQVYDYEVHVAYTPIEYATVAVSLEHAGSVLRDGVVNTFLFHRDETELVFTLSLAY